MGLIFLEAVPIVLGRDRGILAAEAFVLSEKVLVFALKAYSGLLIAQFTAILACQTVTITGIEVMILIGAMFFQEK